MSAGIELQAFLILGWFLSLITVALFIYYKYLEPTMAYARYYDAYRLKVLQDELAIKNITFDQLDDLGFRLFKAKKRKIHTLEEIEQSVRGDLKKVEKPK